MTPERAYRNGWSSAMSWLPREPPPALDAECTELWLEGHSDAMDAPLGSGPGVAELMRVCPVFKHITGAK